MDRTYKEKARFIAFIVVCCAGAALLLWDGTMRFNKVHWQCYYHAHHIHTGNDTAANVTMTATMQYLRHNAGTIYPILYMYDDDNTADDKDCVAIYSQAVAEYIFGIVLAMVALCNLCNIKYIE
jgi:hypothetical protein